VEIAAGGRVAIPLQDLACEVTISETGTFESLSSIAV
jgi:hypothetical protein